MKTIKLAVMAMVLFLVSSTVTSCSDDEKATDATVAGSAKVNEYLKSYYKKDFDLGRSVKTELPKASSLTNRSKEVDDVIITEVFVSGDTRARGYIITDKADGSPLYFIDVDRVDLKMFTDDIKVNNEIAFEDIANMDKYIETNGFDFLKAAEDYDLSSKNNPFWGTGWSTGPCINGQAQLFEDYYVCGIRVRHRPAVGLNGGDMFEPCN